MEKSTTKSRYLRPLAITAFWMVLLGCGLAGLQWYETNVAAPERKAAVELSDEQKLGLEPVCLNGVTYWMDRPFRNTGGMMAPKYSPGSAVPDTCGE